MDENCLPRRRLYDVIIVGGGPVGLLGGFILRKYYDLKCLVLDKSLASPRFSRAFAVSPRTLELFDAIDGLGDEFRDKSTRVRTVQHIADGQEFEWEGFFDIIPGMRDGPVFLEQHVQEGIMRERYVGTGGEIMLGWECVDIRPNDVASTITVRDSTTNDLLHLEGRYLIGADGANSIVRKRLGLSFEGYTDDQQVWFVDIACSDSKVGSFRVHHSSRGGCFEWQITPELRRILVAWGATESEGKENVTWEEASNEIFIRTGKRYSSKAGLVLTSIRFNFRIASAYAVGNCFLAGDAAHVHSAAGGQGLNLGFQDIINLAWKLGSVLRGGLPPHILQSYEPERRPVALDTVAKTGMAHRIFRPRPGWTVRWALSALDHTKALWWPLKVGLLRLVYQSSQEYGCIVGRDIFREKDEPWSMCTAYIGGRFSNVYVKTFEGRQKWLSELRSCDMGTWIYVDGVANESEDDKQWIQNVKDLPAPEPFAQLSVKRIRVTACEWSKAFTGQTEDDIVVVPVDIVTSRAILVGNTSSALYFLRPDNIIEVRSRPAALYFERFRR